MKNRNSIAKKIIISIIIITFSVGVFSLLMKRYIVAQADSEKENAYYLAGTITSNMTQTLESYTTALEMWELLIVRDNGAVKEFTDTSSKILENVNGIDRIELAPGGIINYAYPEKKDSEVGTNLFKDSQLKTLINYAKDNDSIVISSPMQVDSSTFGIVIANPIYRENVAGGRNFWGFSVAIVKLSDMFSTSSLTKLKSEGYEYQLYMEDVDGTQKVIAQTSGDELDNPVEVTFSVPGDFKWTLKLEPLSGWMNNSLRHWLGFGAFIIGLLLGIVICLFLLVRQKEKEFREMSYHDWLTGLYNQRIFSMKTQEYKKKEMPFGIIYIDLNGFKTVNDEYGHKVGDELITSVSQKLESTLNDGDIAVRMGGDEFAVIALGAHDSDFFDEYKNKILDGISGEVLIDGFTIKVSASAGYSRFPEDSKNIDEIVKRADDAMYREKNERKSKRF